ncbi:hypothetical protein [Streptomyces sp. NBC_00663]|uniref:hypothetical protein n=1 Tax=Streptomyces sp. NBC_00663 TaxID=2975801 RepID=UPI002E30052C|nr:hypothetical protein [Streptomyces sp. NBC_00663]
MTGRGLLGGGHQTGDEGGLALAGAATLGDASLLRTAREAFADAMSTTFTVSAIGVLAAALLAVLVMRDAKPRAADRPVEKEAELAA